MAILRNIIISLLATLLAFCTSCIEDGFTTSSSDLLEFSCDTLSFDTIFTEQGTPTKQFVVYNRHKKQINISSISLSSNTAHRFYLNVDGMKGEVFHDVSIRGEDSIFVFVESKLDANGQDAPLLAEDCINFVTNGMTQKVVLRAWGQDVERLTRPQFTADACLTANKPYVIFDTLYVAPGVTLTIEPGTTLYFHDKAAMRIDGTLKACGTQPKPIHLRGDRTDYLFEGANYDIMSGQWGCVEFGVDSRGNEMQYVLMRGSSNGIIVSAASADAKALHLFNSVLHNSSNSVMVANNAWIEAEGCEFSDAAYDVVKMQGGTYRFVNCTFANYYLFGLKFSPIITVVLTDDDGNALQPSVHLYNCIISGNVREFNENDFSGTDVMLRNCMLQSNGSDDDNFINCKWDGDAQFRIERNKYIFDYRLGNESSAIAAGDVSLCPEHALTDRYGQQRIYNGSIDIGAYRWVPVDYNAK
ncbi:MAG: hypothetical protein ACI4AH_06850 [Muribaculaceae bacterium]